MTTLRRLLGAAALALAGLAAIAPAAAETLTVTDVLGRKVEVEAPVKRVILGEGRQMYFVAALDREDPFKRVVAWRDDLPKADPDSYKQYLARYPQIAKLPTFGGMKEGAFDIEQAIALKPDVLFMNVEAHVANDEARLVEKLAGVGIPVVYVDFRDKPMLNTEPSMRLIGKLFDKEKVAEEFISFRAAEIATITDTLSRAKDLKKPLVMMERAAGFSDDCCMSFGNENFGKMVEIAGGINLAAKLIPGTFGTVNAEAVVAANPDVVIITGGNWGAYVPNGKWVGLGPGTDLGSRSDHSAGIDDDARFEHGGRMDEGAGRNALRTEIRLRSQRLGEEACEQPREGVVGRLDDEGHGACRDARSETRRTPATIARSSRMS